MGPRERDVGVGDAVAGFATRAIESANGPNPDVAYDWYVTFLEWIRDTSHPWIGPMVAIGEITIGLLLILGLFTGLAAAGGAVLNFSFVFAGSAGVNPAMILVSFLLILAWRNAGWIGLDRWVLPALGTPWQRGRLWRRDEIGPGLGTPVSHCRGTHRTSRRARTSGSRSSRRGLLRAVVLPGPLELLDLMLDELHEVLQAAFGWYDGHLRTDLSFGESARTP